LRHPQIFSCLDTADVSAGQIGHVWFLGGTWAPTKDLNGNQIGIVDNSSSVVWFRGFHPADPTATIKPDNHRSVARKINIIGAGIAGLTAGCYLQLNGYETRIFEMHSQPGGLCTAWDRKGYTFNGCLHWLVGSAPGYPFHQFWQELIDLSQIEFVHHEVYFRLEDEDGNALDIFTNISRLEQEFLTKAPEDKVEILCFTRALRKLLRFNLEMDKPPELQSFFEKLLFMIKVLPFLATLTRYVKLTNDEYSRRFRNPLLKRAIREMFVPGMSAIFSMFALAWMHQKNAGYPVGGSLQFAQRLEQRYLQLGGKVHYNARVRQITTEHGKATGVVLENGAGHASDIVVSAADGHHTIWNLLGHGFANEEVDQLYREQEIFPSLIQVFLGVRQIFKTNAGAVRILLNEPLQVDPETQSDLLSFTLYNFDPTFAPAGSTSVAALIVTKNFQYWRGLRQGDAARYALEKKRVADAVIDAFEKRFGPIRHNLEVVDVATPATFMRYTNNWKGSFEGWLLNPRIGFRQLNKRLPGLTGFYMIGQWVQQGGGVPGALLSARNVTQVICKADKRKFKTRK
jgi:phytoene dehydrogenase-like protein